MDRPPTPDAHRLLLHNAIDGAVVLDPDTGRILLANAAAARMFGYSSPRTMVGVDPLDHVAEEHRAFLAPLSARVLADDHPIPAEVRMTTRDGRSITVSVSSALVDLEGRKAALATLTEITSDKAKDGALRAAEESRIQLMDAANEGIVIVQDGKLVYANPSVAAVVGASRQQMEGRSPMDFVDPEQRRSIGDLLDRTLTGKTPSEVITVRWVDSGGQPLWAEVREVPSTWRGKPAIMALIRNITGRRRAEEALKSSEERFRGLVETTSDWVWETDRNGRYTYVSPKIREILGYEPGELTGRTPFEFMHPGEVRQLRRTVRALVESCLPFSLLENTWVHRDGHPVVLEASAVPILDSDGGFLGYRGINRDITERKRVELELQRSLNRLEKTMQSTIEAFTSTIETRDPYTAGHQMRVTDLACAIARLMGLPAAQVQGVRVAGLLHDIGKIAIPTEILSKPARLNHLEYVMIKTHARVGHDILLKIEFHWPVARAVLQHHERWNGSGYPDGIRREGILLEARILAVADVVEAMSSHRPYRPSMGPEAALQEITRNSGILYDPAVTAACVSAFTRGGFKFATSATDGSS